MILLSSLKVSYQRCVAHSCDFVRVSDAKKSKRKVAGREVTHSFKIAFSGKLFLKGVVGMITVMKALSMVGAVVLGCGTTDGVAG